MNFSLRPALIIVKISSVPTRPEAGPTREISDIYVTKSVLSLLEYEPASFST